MSEPFPPSPSPFNTPRPVPVAYQAIVPQPKPTSVMVISIIGIVLGALGLICSPLSLLPLFMKSIAPNDPGITAMQSNSALFAWIVFSGIAGTLMAIWLLAASIGSVMFKRWARRAMINYAWTAIFFAVLGLIVTFALVLPATMQAAREMNSAGGTGGTAPPPAAAMGGAIGGAVGGACGTIIAMALPICILIFFKRPNVIEAFERGATLPPSTHYTGA